MHRKVHGHRHEKAHEKARERFIHLILSWPRVVLGLFFVLTLVLGWQARNFTVDASPDTLLTRDNALFTQTQVINQRFAPQEFLLIAYEPQDQPLFSQATFDAIAQLSDELLTLERVESVRSILNVPIFSSSALGSGGLPSGDADMDELTIENGDFELATLEEELTNHPIYENLLLNEDLSAAALQVLFRSNEELDDINARIAELKSEAGASGDGELSGSDGLSQESRQELEELEESAEPLEQALSRQREGEIEKIRAMLAPYQEEADIYMGGVHVLGYQLIQIISNDLVVFGSAIAVIVCLILLVLFRRLRWVLIPVLCCISSVLTTMGLFALLGIKATVISSNFIALQLILTLAIVVHLIVQYRELAAGADLDQRELVAETLRRKIAPCFFAGITTSVGFGSLVFSGIQPVISFGWMMVIAMFFSIITSLILFPALLMLGSRLPGTGDLLPARKLVGGFSYLARRQGGAVLGLSLLFLIAVGVGVSRVDVENSFINYFRDSTLVHQELAYIDQRFGGSTPLDLIYHIQDPPDNEDLVMSAETLQTLQVIQERLDDYEAIGRILSVVNVTELGRQLNDGAPLTEYELTAAYWMVDESLREDLVGAFYDEESQTARMNIWIRDLTEGLNRAELLEDIHAEMADIGLDEEDYQLSNLFVLYQDILQRLFSSQILTLGIVYVVLTLTFFLIFRSLRIGLIAIVPNILTTAAVLGVMGWLGIPLDLMTITIAAIAMGIAVDDTIHYVERYRYELGGEGASGRQISGSEAVERSHRSVGLAILYTTLIISTGFSILAFSDFVPSILFGLLTALAMLIALLADLCLLPALLKRFAAPQET